MEEFKSFSTWPKRTSVCCWWCRYNFDNIPISIPHFSTNEIFGWHIDAYDLPPMLSMAYNKSYYPEFAEKYGFIKNR
jgi:hypothetical protein